MILKKTDQRRTVRWRKGCYFTLMIPICSDLDSFPFVESHEIFYSQPSSLLNIVLVLSGDGILKFHGPHSGEWGGILHPTSNINFVTFTRALLMRGKNKISRRNIRIQMSIILEMFHQIKIAETCNSYPHHSRKVQFCWHSLMDFASPEKYTKAYLHMYEYETQNPGRIANENIA